MLHEVGRLVALWVYKGNYYSRNLATVPTLARIPDGFIVTPQTLAVQSLRTLRRLVAGCAAVVSYSTRRDVPTELIRPHRDALHLRSRLLRVADRLLHWGIPRARNLFHRRNAPGRTMHPYINSLLLLSVLS